MRSVATAALVALCLLLAACGFHLRNAVQLPASLHTTYLEGGDPYSPLITDLRQSLGSSGVKVTRDPAGAKAVLRILDQSPDRRVLSVGATGKAQEYELTYHVAFEVLDAKGRTLMPRQSLQVSRDVVYDATAVLGQANEEDVLWREMQRDLVRLIMLRLGALGGAAPAAPAP